MIQVSAATLEDSGSIQTVTLPPECRFDSKIIYLVHDDVTGDVTLSSYPGLKAWRSFFELVRAANVDDDDFMENRLLNTAPSRTGVFDDEL